MAVEKYQIETENYQNVCYRVTSSLLYFKRTHFRDKEQLEVDVFADFWSVAYLPKQVVPIKILFQNKEISFFGPNYFYIPSHSIIKWVIPSGSLVWQGLISEKPLKQLPKYPISFSVDTALDEFDSEQAVENSIRSIKHFQQVGISSCQHIIAQRTKDWLDKHFQKEAKISEISRYLGVSNSYLTKEFKKSFGLSPVDYRNKMRIYKAMQLFMFSSVKANRVAHEVGFHEYSQFKKNFTILMNAKPKDFKIREL